MEIVVVIHSFAHNSKTVTPNRLIFEPLCRIFNTDILRYQRAFYDIREESYAVNRNPDIQTYRHTDIQTSRRTRNFFLLNRILVIIKRRENTKKVGVEKIFFCSKPNTWPNSIRAEVKLKFLLLYFVFIY